MGLLDWMTEGLGNFGASVSPGTMPPDMAAVMPPVQQTGDDTPPLPQGTPPMPAPPPGVAPPISGPNNNELLPFAQGGDPMAGTGSGNNGGLPPPSPFAQGGDPMAGTGSGREAGSMPPDLKWMSTTPPNAAPTAGTMPPGPPMSLAPPTGAPGDVPGPNGKLNGASSWIGGALGLDSNKEKSLFGSLGAGLTAAGNSKGKSKGQALFSGAGGAIEGGIKAEDKSYDQRLKSLQLAVQAQAAGDKAAYNLNYNKYLGAKLKAETDKAAGGGKSGAWNKPDSQKFIDAQNAMSKDRDIVASQKLLEQAAKDGDPAAIAKAKAGHDALVADKQRLYLTGVGLNPDTIAKNMKTPPGTRENPHTVTSQQDFDRYVKPGEVYINPRDGKPYVRNKGGDGAGDSKAETAPSTPPEAPGPSPEQIGASDEHEEL